MGIDKIVMRPSPTGSPPKLKQTVTVHLRGMLHSNRKEFWSTIPNNQPFSFIIGVGQVIRLLDEGVMTMKVGEKCELCGDASVCYGAKGFEAWGIKPNAPLIFEVELLSVCN